jgi:hypothetical protein
MWWRAILVFLLVHPFSHTLRNILMILISFPSFPPFPLPWIPVHLLVDSYRGCECIAPGVCSRLPFCVQYIKHAEPIRRLATMKKHTISLIYVVKL